MCQAGYCLQNASGNVALRKFVKQTQFLVFYSIITHRRLFKSVVQLVLRAESTVGKPEKEAILTNCMSMLLVK